MRQDNSDNLASDIEHALSFGTFVGYRSGHAFIERLESVQARIAPLIRKPAEAPRAVSLLETFNAGCYEKAEEIDDSGGSFGDFALELFGDWIRARQAAKAGPDETARMLLSWMENDDYGYRGRLGTEAVAALNRSGLDAYERAVMEKAEEAARAVRERRERGMADGTAPAADGAPETVVEGPGRSAVTTSPLSYEPFARAYQ